MIKIYNIAKLKVLFIKLQKVYLLPIPVFDYLYLRIELGIGNLQTTRIEAETYFFMKYKIIHYEKVILFIDKNFENLSLVKIKFSVVPTFQAPLISGAV